ncbi:MAG: hypothetical protein MJ091_01115 [Clostridia bacterium]|nr:hypothetical protein [Clostridia bacterium]
MKKKVFSVIYTVVICAILFSSFAYGYLKISAKREENRADTKQNNVPYSKVPQNCGIKFCFSDGSAELIFLDFTDMKVVTVDIEENDSTKKEYFGYIADKTVVCDYNAIKEIVDSVGGIELYENGEILRFTGVQIIDKVSYNTTADLRKAIVRAVLERISKDGFSTSQFSLIIDLCDTDLTVPECYNFSKYIEEMCLRITQL